MSYFRSITGRVVSCVLYLITGVLSGLIMVGLMGMAGSLGGGSSITMYISLLGSLLLVIAAVTALFGFRGAGYIAVAAIVAGWVFWWSPGFAPLYPARILLLLVLMLVSLAYPVASIVSTLRTAE